MPVLSRRDLLASGVALSASSLLARSAWGRAAALLGNDSGTVSAAALAAVAPREQLLFDFGWKFQFGHGTDPARDLDFGFGQGDFAKTGDFKFAKAGFDDSKWRTLNLPHDWAGAAVCSRRGAELARLQADWAALSGDERGLVPADI